MEDDDFKIDITVTNPEQKSATVNKFVVYTVKGKDKHGAIQILRRYSDFDLLREILSKRWPGCYLPSLPEKKTIGNNETVFVQSRRRMLEQFLIILSQLTAIWYEEQVQLFLRNQTGDSEKALTTLLKQPLDKYILRYSKIYPQYETIEFTNAHQSKVLQFTNYLQHSKIVITKLEQISEKMVDSTKKYHEKKLNLMEFILPDYEKNCLLENDQKRKQESYIFLYSKNNGIAEYIDKYKKICEYPPILIVQEEIKKQKREIQAFEALIGIKDEYQASRQKSIAKVKQLEIQHSKLEAGKEKLFSKITFQSKESQLLQNKTALQKAKNDQKNYTTFCHYINLVIAILQIDRFKQIRQKAYYNLLKKLSTCENQLAKLQKQMWECVGKHDMIGLTQNDPFFNLKLAEKEEYIPDMATIKQELGEQETIEHKNKNESEQIPL